MKESSTEQKMSQLKRLIGTSSNPRQRAMYQQLLEKAEQQSEKERVSRKEKAVSTKTTQTSKESSPLPQKSSQKSSKGKKVSQQGKEVLMSAETTAAKKEKKPVQPAIFQAIGVIEGIVSMESNSKLAITIEGVKYPLGYVGSSKKERYLGLLEEIKLHNSQKRKITVYPIYNHHGKERGSLSFNLVSVERKDKRGKLFEELAPGEFRIAGFWQYVPFCERPCITIFRNYQKGLALWVKKMSAQKAREVLKANHVPLDWSKAPISAFQYNEELSPQEQMPRYFVQLKVKWKEESEFFEFREEIEVATTKPPKYLKHKG